MRRHLIDLVRWYSTPVGVGFGILIVAGLVLLPLGYPIPAAICGAFALGVVVPYKLSRERQYGNRHETQLRQLHQVVRAVQTAPSRDELRGMAIEEVERVDALTNARIDTIEHHLDKRFSQLARELRKQADQTLAEVRDMRHLHVESMTRVERALNAADSLAESLANSDQQVDSIRESHRALARELRNAVRGERNDRIVSVARAIGRTEASGQLLLILTPPRTGSTWLLDALRAHPDIHFESTPRALSVLHLSNMNRYPSGLSDQENAELDVEVSPGRGARIPDYSVEGFETYGDRQYSVEKIHPLFYEFDTSYFVEQITKAERQGLPVQLLVRLRDPEFTMRSILRYKMRDSGWYRFVSLEEVPKHVERSLRSILEVVKVHGGLLSRYEDHVKDPIQEISSLYGALWPDVPADRHKEIAGAVVSSVTRSRRTGTGAFLPAETSEFSIGDDDVDEIVESASDLIERCRQIDAEIQSLLAR